MNVTCFISNSSSVVVYRNSSRPLVTVRSVAMSQVATNKWRPIKFSERNYFLFNNEYGSDVTFFFPGKLPKRVPGHKVILACASEVFDAMFYGDLKEKDVIELPDVDPEAFLALLRFIYTEEVRLTADIIVHALYASKKYMVDSFTQACIKHFKSILRPGNAILLYSNARRFKEQDLESKCLDVIEANGERALKSFALLDLDRSAVEVIIQRDTLICSELAIFEALEMWATAECLRDKLKVTPANKRKVLGDLLFLVRFPTMTLEEFTKGPAASELLSRDERLDLFLHITEAAWPTLPFPTTVRNPPAPRLCNGSSPVAKTNPFETPLEKYSTYDFSEIKLTSEASEPRQIKHGTRRIFSSS